MQRERFEELLGTGSAALGLALDAAQGEALYRYFRELKHWSRRINLIARETADERIVENHFIDSLALLAEVDERDDCLLDIGTGAGFPGLVCAAARPRLQAMLVEPRLKRVSFLRHVIRTLGLTNVAVQAVRLEHGSALPEEDRISCVVSRAVADIGEFLALCARFRRPGCRVVCMKGPRYREELAEGAGALAGWRLATCKTYQLPLSRASRALLVFQGTVDGGPGKVDMNNYDTQVRK